MRKNAGKSFTRAQDKSASVLMFKNFMNLAVQNLDLDHRGKFIECHKGALLKEKM